MSRGSDLIVEVPLAGDAGLLAPQLSNSLTTGLHQGVHLRPESTTPESTAHNLRGPGGFLSGSVSRVRLSVESASENESMATVELWSPGPRRRCLALGALAGALMATAGALAMGWLISVSIPVSVGCAVVVDQVCWRSWMRRQRHNIQAMLHKVSAEDSALQ